MICSLEDLGYTRALETEAKGFLEEGYTLARVTSELKLRYLVRTETAELPATVAGKIMYHAQSRMDYPAVGDWVAVRLLDNNSHAVIHNILPRRTILQRRAPGKRVENQIIATNIDAVFIVFPLNQPWTPRALERYLITVRQSGARPIVLLSKRDQVSDETVKSILDAIRPVCNNETILPYSLFNQEEIAAIASNIQRGVTFCLLGPSGAGKSSLINALVGQEVLPTGDVRPYDAKGRHVTTQRQLVLLETGGILIDTPGLREVGLWDAYNGLEETFADIFEVANDCHFRNCTHTHEPKCAVRAAVERGDISNERYTSFIHYQEELRDVQANLDPKRAKEQREQQKKKFRHQNSQKRKGTSKR